MLNDDNVDYKIRRNYFTVEEILDMLNEEEPEPVIIQLPYYRTVEDEKE